MIRPAVEPFASVRFPMFRHLVCFCYALLECTDNNSFVAVCVEDGSISSAKANGSAPLPMHTNTPQHNCMGKNVQLMVVLVIGAAKAKAYLGAYV